MKNYTAQHIRNIALIAHSKAGKTSLAETMLFLSGAINRIGKTAEGNTVCDYDSEEIKRTCSLRTSLAAVEWKDTKLNIVDTPGYFDFVSDMYASMTACDLGLICVSGKSGIKVGGEIAFKEAKKLGLPIMFYINKMDHANVDFDKYYGELKEKFGSKAVAMFVPVFEDKVFKGYIDVVEKKAYMLDGGKLKEAPIPADYADVAEEEFMAVCEAVAETDEALMDKFLSEEPFTDEELLAGIKAAIISRDIYPVLCGSAIENWCVDALMDALVKYAPSPAEMPAKKTASGDEIVFGDDAPVCAQVFKTINDQYVGKVSLFRVYGGKITKNMTVYNTDKMANEKIGTIHTMYGKEKIDIDTAVCGDICASSKLSITGTNDTFSAADKKYKIADIEFPKPVYTMAFAPVKRGEDEKLAQGLFKLCEEDKTLEYKTNSEIGQLLVSGLGDQHLDLVVSRLKQLGTDVTTCEPRVTYRETITRKIQAEGKHKKQSGGHGQYGHVKIEFEPCEGEELIFEEKIFGGSVPKNYHPAVEKGLNEMMHSGIQAGYRVVGVKATLYDGSYHDVDSSEMAFKMAAHLAFKELTKAGPVLLEPIGKLEVSVPEKYTGDVMGDINKRRGRVLGIEPEHISAEVPMSEMNKYAIDLRSMTQGSGSFDFEFVRYEQAPPQVSQKVISEYTEKE